MAGLLLLWRFLLLTILSLSATNAYQCPLERLLLQPRPWVDLTATRTARRSIPLVRAQPRLYSMENLHPTNLIRKSATSFCKGSVFVHQNYLQLLGFLFPKVLAVEATLLVTASLVHALSPALESTIIQSISAVLQFLGKIAYMYQIPCIALVMIPLVGFLYLFGLAAALLLPSSLQTSPNAVSGTAEALGTSFVQHWLSFRVVSRSVGSSPPLLEALQSAPTVLRYATLLFLGPIIDEIMFRLFFDEVCRRIPRSEDDTRWFGKYRPWVILSSAVFALSHVNNWYQRGGGAMDLQYPLSRLTLATFQVSTSYLLGLHVFLPLYVQHGIMGSIGAHVTWNILSLFLKWQMVGRLVVRWLRDTWRTARHN